MNRQNPFLEISPFRIDGGERVGRLPADVNPEILRENFRAQIPLKAIRARCLDCCCGDNSEVRKCVAVACPGWPFRMGTNPFRKKARLSETERRRRTERLKAIRNPEQKNAPAGVGPSSAGAVSIPDSDERKLT